MNADVLSDFNSKQLQYYQLFKVICVYQRSSAVYIKSFGVTICYNNSTCFDELLITNDELRLNLVHPIINKEITTDLIEKTASTATNQEPTATIFIVPEGAWLSLDWRELWHYRELLYFLSLRDLKVRYKQSLLGVAWVLLQPIATTLIFVVLFSRLGQQETSGVPYTLFAFSGFVIWTFVNMAVTSASNSLINHTALITKTYFPRLIVPAAAVTAHLADLLIGLLSLFVAMLIFGFMPSWKIVFLPFFIVLILLQTSALGIALAALNVQFRDVKQLLPFILQLWFFLTPIFYSLKFLPENLAWLWKLNPLTGALSGFRTSLFGGDFDFSAIILSVLLSFLVLFFSLFIFRRMENGFADVI